MSKKGFTLIELLAVIIVLSMVTILIAPSIVGAIDSSRKKTMLSISSLAVLNAKAYISSNENFSAPITSGEVKLVTFEILGMKSTKTSYGATIDLVNSYVLIDNSSNYYVTLTTASGEKGIKNVLYTKLTKEFNIIIIFESDDTNNLGVPDVSAMTVPTTLQLDTTGNGKPGDITSSLIEIRN